VPQVEHGQHSRIMRVSPANNWQLSPREKTQRRPHFAKCCRFPGVLRGLGALLRKMGWRNKSASVDNDPFWGSGTAFVGRTFPRGAIGWFDTGIMRALDPRNQAIRLHARENRHGRKKKVEILKSKRYIGRNLVTACGLQNRHVKKLQELRRPAPPKKELGEKI